MTPEPLGPIELSPIGRGTVCAGLKCNNREIDEWFSKKALKEHRNRHIRVTCAHEDGKPDRPLGFYALATVAEETTSLPGRYHAFRGGEYFSALQLVWLATDKGFAGRGLGSLMVGDVIRKFAEIGQIIGLPHLIVVPARQDHDRLTDFYKNLGFSPYKSGEAMFLPLQSAVETVQRMQDALADSERAERA